MEDPRQHYGERTEHGVRVYHRPIHCRVAVHVLLNVCAEHVMPPLDDEIVNEWVPVAVVPDLKVPDTVAAGWVVICRNPNALFSIRPTLDPAFKVLVPSGIPQAPTKPIDKLTTALSRTSKVMGLLSTDVVPVHRPT
jgi:hypothetical protein